MIEIGKWYIWLDVWVKRLDFEVILRPALYCHFQRIRHADYRSWFARCGPIEVGVLFLRP